MFKGINKVFIMGYVGLDPEIRYMSSGNAVVNISVATSDVLKDKVTGEIKTKTEWHKVVLYSKLGELAHDILKKGSKVYIEGSLKTSKWQGKDGSPKYTTQIVAVNMQALDLKDQKSDFAKSSDNNDIFVEDKNKGKAMFFDENIPF